MQRHAAGIRIAFVHYDEGPPKADGSPSFEYAGFAAGGGAG